MNFWKFIPFLIDFWVMNYKMSILKVFALRARQCVGFCWEGTPHFVLHFLRPANIGRMCQQFVEQNKDEAELRATTAPTHCIPFGRPTVHQRGVFVQRDSQSQDFELGRGRGAPCATIPKMIFLWILQNEKFGCARSRRRYQWMKVFHFSVKFEEKIDIRVSGFRSSSD